MRWDKWRGVLRLRPRKGARIKVLLQRSIISLEREHKTLHVEEAFRFSQLNTLTSIESPAMPGSAWTHQSLETHYAWLSSCQICTDTLLVPTLFLNSSIIPQWLSKVPEHFLSWVLSLEHSLFCAFSLKMWGPEVSVTILGRLPSTGRKRLSPPTT